MYTRNDDSPKGPLLLHREDKPGIREHGGSPPSLYTEQEWSCSLEASPLYPALEEYFSCPSDIDIHAIVETNIDCQAIKHNMYLLTFMLTDI
jgi:hypothetical protein